MRIVYIVLLATAACMLAADSDSPAALEKLADSPSRVVLYSLKPAHDDNVFWDESFRGYPIRGQADITDPNERRALLQALARGTREAASGRVVAACFNPRHGLRVEQGSYAADFVICFECLQVQACGFQPSDLLIITATPQPVFDESLRRHNLPLPDKSSEK